MAMPPEQDGQDRAMSMFMDKLIGGYNNRITADPDAKKDMLVKDDTNVGKHNYTEQSATAKAMLARRKAQK